MVDKRYQVFVSSTFRDLAKERLIAFNSILQAKCFPAGMENFPVLTGDSLKYIYKLIDESDFFLLILGGRYGSSRDGSGVSYTHLEARYALKTGKPIIALYPLDWGKLDDKETSAENISKLVGFIEEIKEKFDGAKPWTTETLSNLVYRGVEQAIKDHPQAVGWVRADAIPAAAQQTLEGQRAIRNKGIENLFSFIDKRLNDEVEIETEITFSSSELIRYSDGKFFYPYDIHHVFKCSWRDIFFAFAHKIDRTMAENECVASIEEMLKEKFAEQINEHMMDGYDEIKINIDAHGIYHIRREFIDNNLVNVTTMQSFYCWHISEFGDKYLRFLHNTKFHPNLYR